MKKVLQLGRYTVFLNKDGMTALFAREMKNIQNGVLEKAFFQCCDFINASVLTNN